MGYWRSEPEPVQMRRNGKWSIFWKGFLHLAKLSIIYTISLGKKLIQHMLQLDVLYAGQVIDVSLNTVEQGL